MTSDFRSFDRHGAIMSPEDKDAAFLPRQFGGRWALTAAAIGLLGGALGALYPAARAANLDPVNALAYE